MDTLMTNEPVNQVSIIPANASVIASQNMLVSRGYALQNFFDMGSDTYKIVFVGDQKPTDEEERWLRAQGWIGFDQVWRYPHLFRWSRTKKSMSIVNTPILNPAVMA